MSRSYVLTSVTTLFASVALAIFCASSFYPQETATPIINGFGVGLLTLIPGVIACVPYLFHLTNSLHRLTWAGGSLLALVAVSMFTLVIEADSEQWLFFIGQAFVLAGYAFSQSIELRSERVRRIALLVTRVVGVLAIVLPTIGALLVSMPTPTSFITPTILLICAACFGLNLRINGAPVGYALPLVMGVIAILSVAVTSSFLVLGVWIVATGFLAIGMITTTIDASLTQATHDAKPEAPRAPKSKTPQPSGSASA